MGHVLLVIILLNEACQPPVITWPNLQMYDVDPDSDARNLCVCRVPWWLSGLKIWCYHCCSSDGFSMPQGGSKEKKKEKKKEIYMFLRTYFLIIVTGLEYLWGNHLHTELYKWHRINISHVWTLTYQKKAINSFDHVFT